MAMSVFAYLRIWVVRAPKRSRKYYRRHHLKKMFLRFLLRICIFVFKSKKSQPYGALKNRRRSKIHLTQFRCLNEVLSPDYGYCTDSKVSIEYVSKINVRLIRSTYILYNNKYLHTYFMTILPCRNCTISYIVTKLSGFQRLLEFWKFTEGSISRSKFIGWKLYLDKLWKWKAIQTTKGNPKIQQKGLQYWFLYKIWLLKKVSNEPVRCILVPQSENICHFELLHPFPEFGINNLNSICIINGIGLYIWPKRVPNLTDVPPFYFKYSKFLSNYL
jgi:hypothetical protein